MNMQAAAAKKRAQEIAERARAMADARARFLSMNPAAVGEIRDGLLDSFADLAALFAEMDFRQVF